MPEYSQIQTYMKYSKNHVASVLAQLMAVLSELGFTKEYLEEYFSDREWKMSDDGFMYSYCNTKSVRINLFGQPLNIRPLVMGWTHDVIKEIREPWLEISLLFETEEIEDYPMHIKDSVKLSLWKTLVLFSKQFQEAGVYLTDEVTDGKPWEALMDCNNDFWSFDAAIVPADIASQYNPINLNFNGQYEESGCLYLINKNTWGKSPW